MTKQHRHLVFVTFLISCVALALLLVSIATTNWVLSNPECIKFPGIPDSTLNYGLFTGSYTRPSPLEDKFGLTMVCLFEHNICGLSCKSTEAERRDELEQLYNDKQPKFNCARYTGRSERSVFSKNTTILADTKNDLTFINNGVHLTTIIFLCIAIILSTISCVITVMNLTMNPVQSILNIFGLYIWHSVTSLSILIVILLWGIHFAITISHNCGLRDTIVNEYNSDGRSSLGYSYWILLGSMLLHLINIGILFFRRQLINKEAPTIAASNEEQTDGAIYLY